MHIVLKSLTIGISLLNSQILTYIGQGAFSSFPTDNNFFMTSLDPLQKVFCFIFQINSVVLKEDLRSMVENFYAALFGYDEVRRMFSEKCARTNRPN